MSDDVTAHPKCARPDGHACQKPSGRTCIEQGCQEAAGTLWGPLWCPEHDADRLDHVSAQMESLLSPARPTTERTPDE